MTGWAQSIVVPSGLLSDRPALEAFLKAQHDQALLDAAAAGVTVNGEPEVTVQNAVMVPDWDEQGPMLVSEDVARLGGSDEPVTAAKVFLRWD